MVLKSYSKINLTLNVNKKLKSGLHDIQSYYCLINLSDKIKITKNKTNKDKILFKRRFGNYVSTSSNSITHLLKILRGSKLIHITTQWWLLKISQFLAAWEVAR